MVLIGAARHRHDHTIDEFVTAFAGLLGRQIVGVARPMWQPKGSLACVQRSRLAEGFGDDTAGAGPVAESERRPSHSLRRSRTSPHLRHAQTPHARRAPRLWARDPGEAGCRRWAEPASIVLRAARRSACVANRLSSDRVADWPWERRRACKGSSFMVAFAPLMSFDRSRLGAPC